MRQDLIYALRSIARQPGLAIATVLTLALGLGLNIGVFTVIDGVMFRARVQQDPASFIHLSPEYRYDRPTREIAWAVSVRDYRAFAAGTKTLSDVAAWNTMRVTVGHEESSTLGMLVTCNFFRVYGQVRPVQGRLFNDDECSPGTVSRAAIVSEAFVRSRFGGDSNMVGRTVTFNRIPFTVIAVLPADYAGRLRGPGIWIPWVAQPLFYDGRDLFRADTTRWLTVEGRLMPRHSRSEAESELSVIAARQDKLEPGRKTTISLTNGSLGEEPSIRSLVFWMASLVMGALLLILLIVCTNVTVLQLSRSVERRREMGIRLALGAARGRLTRMLLTEILILSAIATALSLYVAYLSPDLFKKMLAATPDTPVFQSQPDLRVFGYLCLAALASAAVAGLSPAAEALRVDLQGSMKAGGAASGMGRNRKHGFLISAQVAMSMTLLVGAVLFVRAQQRMFSADPGFEVRQVLSVSLRKGVDATAVSDMIATIPQVKNVAMGSPLGQGEFGGDLEEVRINGQRLGTGKHSRVNTVSGNYFETLRIGFLRGHTLRNASEAVVSQAFAQRFLPEKDPLGETAILSDGTALVVAGVIRDLQTEHAGIKDGPVLYRWAGSAGNSLVVGFEGDSHNVAMRVRDVVRRFDPDVSTVPKTLRNLMDENAERITSLVRMIGVLGLLALSLSALGIYGVIAFAVSRRTKELGIRMALGATRRLIVQSVFAVGFRPIGWGLAAGLVLALAVAQSLARFMSLTPVPIDARDPATFTLVTVLLATVAILAMLKPAMRAAGLDPARALRDD
jgi:macrolide transport system ATP-binding/permease protein